MTLLHVWKLLTDLGPELRHDCQEILQGVDPDIEVLVFEQSKGARCLSALIPCRPNDSPALVVMVATGIVDS